MPSQYGLRCGDKCRIRSGVDGRTRHYGKEPRAVVDAVTGYGAVAGICHIKKFA